MPISRGKQAHAKRFPIKAPQVTPVATAVALVVPPAPAVQGALAMTSREVAELTGKEHRNVLADIRGMLEALEIDVLTFQQMSEDTYGRPQAIFALPKDLTITLVSGYSVPMRHRIVTRWLELEAKEVPILDWSFLIPSTTAGALDGS